jgi:hypothetical protein
VLPSRLGSGPWSYSVMSLVPCQADKDLESHQLSLAQHCRHIEEVTALRDSRQSSSVLRDGQLLALSGHPGPRELPNTASRARYRVRS